MNGSWTGRVIETADWPMIWHRLSQIEERLQSHRKDPLLASMLSSLRDELVIADPNQEN